MKITKLVFTFAFIFTFFDLTIAQEATCIGKYEIKFTKVPSTGSGPKITRIIAGTVVGKTFTEYQIVLYAKAGGKWWVQPTTENPYTKIYESGKWQNETHLGEQYAAIIVSKNYKPAAVLYTLPELAGGIHAICIVDASK